MRGGNSRLLPVLGCITARWQLPAADSLFVDRKDWKEEKLKGENNLGKLGNIAEDLHSAGPRRRSAGARCRLLSCSWY